jgi:hypothetical protein
VLNVSALYSLLHHRYILVLSALRTCVIFVQYCSRGSNICGYWYNVHSYTLYKNNVLMTELKFLLLRFTFCDTVWLFRLFKYAISHVPLTMQRE